jgi:hypothetical protein
MPAKRHTKKEQDLLTTEIRRWLNDGSAATLARILEEVTVEHIKDYTWASEEEKPLHVAKHLAELGGAITERAMEFLRDELNGAYGRRLRATYARAEETAARNLVEEPAEEDIEEGETEGDEGGVSEPPENEGAVAPDSTKPPEGQATLDTFVPKPGGVE